MTYLHALYGVFSLPRKMPRPIFYRTKKNSLSKLVVLAAVAATRPGTSIPAGEGCYSSPILNPEPSTLNPRTLDPEPWTLDPQPWTLDPQPQTREFCSRKVRSLGSNLLGEAWEEDDKLRTLGAKLGFEPFEAWVPT